MHTQQYVQTLYLAIYGRAAEWEEMLYWSKGIDSSGFEGLTALTESAEYRDLYGGGLSSAEVVGKIYQHLFGRTADAEGIDYWATKVDAGESLISLAHQLADGAQGSDVEALSEKLDNAQTEAFGTFVDVLYAGYFGRASDKAGRDFWIQELKENNADFLSVVNAFGASGE